MRDPKWLEEDKRLLLMIEDMAVLGSVEEALKRAHAHIWELRAAGGMATEYEPGGTIERGGILTLASILDRDEPPEIT